MKNVLLRKIPGSGSLLRHSRGKEVFFEFFVINPQGERRVEYQKISEALYKLVSEHLFRG
jgi:hypothetical protein